MPAITTRTTSTMGISDLLSGIRQTAQSVERQFRETRRLREQLRRDRDALRTRPAVKADVKAMLVESVKSKRDEYAKHFTASLVPFVNRPTRLTDPRERRPSLAGAAAPGAEFLAPADVDALLCVLFPDAVIAAVSKLVDEMDFPENGVSLADLAKQTAKLDRQIQDMDVELEEVITAANRAGLVLNLHHIEDI